MINDKLKKYLCPNFCPNFDGLVLDKCNILVVQLFYQPMGNDMLPWPPGTNSVRLAVHFVNCPNSSSRKSKRNGGMEVEKGGTPGVPPFTKDHPLPRWHANGIGETRLGVSSSTEKKFTIACEACS